MALPKGMRKPPRKGKIGKKVAYFKGCALEGPARDYDASARLVAKALGLELDQLEDFNCCGSLHVKNLSFKASLLLGARNFSVARAQGHGALVAPCNGCSFALKRAERLLSDEGKLSELNRLLEEAGERPVDELPQAHHLLEWLYNEAGPEEVKKNAVRPLKGLKVACYYGCLYGMPRVFSGAYPHASKEEELAVPYGRETADDDEHPYYMDALLEAAGAETVELGPYATSCCGSYFSLVEPELARSMALKVLKEAHARGARLLAVACPACKLSLETALARHEDLKLSVVYFTQLLALAFGHPPGSLGLTEEAWAG
ncbi:MAG: disulfide reductase [Aquificae bacterium]|nr:disulfide reductase [Aquificota bacterium]